MSPEQKYNYLTFLTNIRMNIDLDTLRTKLLILIKFFSLSSLVPKYSATIKRSGFYQ